MKAHIWFEGGAWRCAYGKRSGRRLTIYFNGPNGNGNTVEDAYSAFSRHVEMLS